MVTKILFFLLLISSQLFTQTKKLIYIDDTTQVINFKKEDKLFILGEYHWQFYNTTIEYNYLKLLNNVGIYPKYIILEDGYGYSYLLNKFLLSGSMEYLNACSYSIIWDKNLLIEIYNYRNKLPKTKQFLFYGVDTDKSISEVFIPLYYILKKQTLTDTGKTIANINFYEFATEFHSRDYFDIGLNAMVEKVDMFYKIYKTDSLSLKQEIKIEYNEVQKIFNTYSKYKKFRHVNFNRTKLSVYNERENFIANNIYTLYKGDTTAVLYGQFGIAHIPLNKTKIWGTRKNVESMATTLNINKNYELLNNKINSTLIFYDEVPKRWYYFYINDKKELNKLYEKNSNLIIQIDKPSSDSLINNLLFINKKLIDSTNLKLYK